MTGASLSPWRSLSGQLLVLTIALVMVVEVFIYVPSLAQFRKNFLDQRLVAAQIAALAMEGAGGAVLSPELEQELLGSAEIQAVVIVSEGARELVLRSDLPEELTATYDLRDPGLLELVGDAFATLMRGGQGSIQIEGTAIATRHQAVQVVMEEKPLYAAMVSFSTELLASSLLISLVTASVIFLVLNALLVRPTQRLARHLTRFSSRPEDRETLFRPSGRANEIGLLEAEVARMETEVQSALRQKSHLAELGLAVSRINHDLKNILAGAQLSLDSFATAAGRERQKQSLERLSAAVTRAVSLCERTLRYAKAEDQAPVAAVFPLRPLLEEAAAMAHGPGERLEFRLVVPPKLALRADRDQTFRIVFNLMRNALEAMGGKGTLDIDASAGPPGVAAIRFRDRGPGIPERVRDQLFAPFLSSTKGSGFGLGLSTAKALAEANRGTLALAETGPGGTVFHLTLPLAKEEKSARARRA
jgi:signal transduction histidine kinase